MVRVGAPGAVTVIVPLRAAPVLAVTLSRKDPLPVRLGGAKLSTVSQAVLLDTTVQVALEVTLIVILFAVAAGFQADCDSVRVGVAACPAWVTVMVRAATPGADTVIAPVRAAVPGLAVALTVKLPLFVRLTGLKLLAVSQG